MVRRGQLDAAKEICTAAISESPEASGVYLKLAEIAARQKSYDESLAHCTMAHRLAPYTHPPKVLLAVFCCANGNQELGLKLLREARTESPANPVSVLILGQLARRQQQLKSAKSQTTLWRVAPFRAISIGSADTGHRVGPRCPLEMEQAGT
jgi:cytochrome c-type biogenesis protein CcmH/NrfG